jgi:hypothetical protein
MQPMPTIIGCRPHYGSLWTAYISNIFTIGVVNTKVILETLEVTLELK